ncbi:MAG: hypothetical protein JSS48_17935 [Nitrospira sp.]|nr:hypothetical protein [Nitrospira sp.]
MFRDPKFYNEFRSFIERDLGSVHHITHRDSPMQAGARQHLFQRMQDMLETRPDIATTLIPDFPVGCKRLTPGPGYLEALTSDEVEFVSTEIESFTDKGLRTVDGTDHEFDAIICATGFDVSSVPAFPIYGDQGVNLQDMWRKEVSTYLSVMVPKMPNL